MQPAGDTRARNIVIARNEMTKQSSKYKSAPFGAALFTWIPWSNHGMTVPWAGNKKRGEAPFFILRFQIELLVQPRRDASGA